MRHVARLLGRRRRYACAVGLWVVAVVFATTGLPGRIVRAEPPSNDWFANTWSRTDRPVTDLKVSRTWMWGSAAFTGDMREDYTQAPDGQRAVQYFDKTRMEVNPDPAVADDSP